MKYKNFAERLKSLQIEKGLKTQIEVSKWSGFSRSIVSEWMRGECIPSMDTAIKLAEMFNCNTEWLLRGVGPKTPEQPTLHYDGIAHNRLATEENNINNHIQLEIRNVEIQKGNITLVPLISWVQAGEWCEAHDPFPSGYAEEWVPVSENCSSGTYALIVQGDSMTSPHPGQRSYPEGITIVVDPGRDVTNGCRVIAKLIGSNEVTFKEYREDGGKSYLKPLNPQYQMQEIDERTHICGVVIYAGWKE